MTSEHPSDSRPDPGKDSGSRSPKRPYLGRRLGDPDVAHARGAGVALKRIGGDARRSANSVSRRAPHTARRNSEKLQRW